MKTFKPLDTIHLYYCIFLFILGLPFDIICVITWFELHMVLIQVVYNSAIVIAFILTRIIYQTKYEISEDYLVQKRGSRIVFKVAVSNVKAIYIKKAKWYDMLSFFKDGILTQSVESHGTVISFAYSAPEISEDLQVEIPRNDIKPKYENSEYQEHVELFSLRKSLEICKLLKTTPIYVN